MGRKRTDGRAMVSDLPSSMDIGNSKGDADT